MIYELFLSGRLVDIRQDLGVQLSYTIDDINKYGSRDTSFSKTIVLPGTSRNNSVFGFINEIGSSNDYDFNLDNINYNFNVAQPTPCELRANGLLLMKGIFRLTGITRTKNSFDYEGSVFGELGGFISEINGKRLEQLNFGEYDHNYTVSNITNSWNSINGDGYYYPLIDYGTYSDTKKDYELQTFRPAIYVKEYLDKMFANTNYVYESNFLNSNFFKSLIVPNNTKELRTSNSVQFIANSSTSTNSENATINFQEVSKAGDFITTDNIVFEYTGTTSFKPIYGLRVFHGFVTDEPRNQEFRLKATIKHEKSTGTITTDIDPTTVYDFIIPRQEDYRLTVFALNIETEIVSGRQYAKLTLQGNPLNFTYTSLTYNTNVGRRPQTNTNFIIQGVSGRVDGSYRYAFATATQSGTGSGEIIATHLYFFGRAPRTETILSNITIIYTPQARIPASATFQRLDVPFYSKSGEGAIIDQGDKLSLVFEGYASGVTTYIPNTNCDNRLNISSRLTIESTVPILTRAVLNDRIFVNDSVPRNIFQKDFLTWIIQMFNLYITEDKNIERKLLIEPYKDFYDFSESEDWTYKVARDKPWQIKPMGMLNGRFFEYKFKDDNDFYNEGHKKKWNRNYGDRLEDSNFQFAKEKQTISVGFSPTVLVEYSGQDKIVSTIFKKTKGNSVDQEERIDSNIRILMAKKINVNLWSIMARDARNNLYQLTPSGLSSYGYAGHFDDPRNPTKDINFGAADQIYFNPNSYTTNNLFNNYWSDYIAEIVNKDSKLLTCHVYLNDLDIAKLDFSKPVFIDGVLWRINKVMDYDATSGELTKVELLKVINNG